MAEMRSVICEGVSGRLVSTDGSSDSSTRARPFQPFSSGRSSGKRLLPLGGGAVTAGCACAAGASKAVCTHNSAAAAATRAAREFGADNERTGRVPGLVLLYLTTSILAVLSPDRPFHGACMRRAPAFPQYDTRTADAAYPQFPHA